MPVDTTLPEETVSIKSSLTQLIVPTKRDLPEKPVLATKRRFKIPNLDSSSFSSCANTFGGTAGLCSHGNISTQLDINDITFRDKKDQVKSIHLGALSSVASHKEKHYPNQPVLIINANAVVNNNPLSFDSSSFTIKLLRSDRLAQLKGIDDVVFFSDPKTGDKVLNIHMYDSCDVKISGVFDIVNNHIKTAIDHGMPVYVACHAGISRSASLVIAFLMAHCGSQFNDHNHAIQYVNRFRQQVWPNLGFCFQLQEYFAHLSDTNSRIDSFSVDSSVCIPSVRRFSQCSPDDSVQSSVTVMAPLHQALTAGPADSPDVVEIDGTLSSYHALC